MKDVRVLLVGCGNISHAWLSVATKFVGVEIAGLIDLNEKAARERAREFGLTDVYVGKDLANAISVMKPDAIFDCTAPQAHKTVTMLALSRGCHVLGEKPMADSMENARQMVQTALDYGKIYAVMQNRRYAAHILAVRRFLDSLQIGKIHTVNADFYLGPHFGGFREQMKHVLLLDMAVHTFDQARFLTGADPVCVFCHEYNPPGSWYKHGACAQAIFEMTGGIIFNYRGSWCAEGLSTSWEAQWRFVGSDGTVLWDGGENIRAAAPTPAPNFIRKERQLPVEPVILDEAMTGHGGIIQDFLYCLMEGGLPQTICTDNIKSLAMVFGAVESAKKGRPIEIVV